MYFLFICKLLCSLVLSNSSITTSYNFLLPVHPDKDITEEEEAIKRKVKSKPRRSKKQAERNEATTMTKSTTDFDTSEYFQSSVKAEEGDSEEDFDLGSSAAPSAGVNKKKAEKDAEGEEDSEEDEDDWEEVEGRSHVSSSCWACVACSQGSHG